MMKKLRSLKGLMILLASIFIFSGCSIIQEVGNAVDYAGSVKSYVTNMVTLTGEARDLTTEGSFIKDELAREQLISKLVSIKAEITTFKTLNPPDMAADLHQKMLDSSLSMEQGVDIYLEELRKDQIDPKKLLKADEHLNHALNQINSIWTEIQNILNL
jgi:hypothetical protein